MLGLGLIGSMFLAGAIQAQPPIPPEANRLEALRTVQEKSIKEIDREIVSLLVNKERMDVSAALRAEEAASLKLRFPAIAVRDDYNTDQFVAALRVERLRALHELEVTLQTLQASYRSNACAALMTLRQNWRKMQTDADWLRLSTRDRMEIREAIETIIRESVKQDDPCLPHVEKPAEKDANMELKTNMEL